MNKIKEYTFDELSVISTDEFNKWKGLTLHVIKNDGVEFKGEVSNLQIAGLSDPAQLVCGFIFIDDTSINLQSIKTVCLYE